MMMLLLITVIADGALCANSAQGELWMLYIQNQILTTTIIYVIINTTNREGDNQL